MDHAIIAYGLTWVGTGAWVVCFWWMHRISARQDALLTELRELAQTQQDILLEVHPDVGEIKEHVVEEQGEKINEISEQVTQVADAVASPEASAAAGPAPCAAPPTRSSPWAACRPCATMARGPLTRTTRRSPDGRAPSRHPQARAARGV
jgi:hypothetical protein